MKKLGFILAALCTTGLFNAQKKWTLQECVDYATKNNLQVLQNEISKRNQDKNLQISKRGYLPTVSGTFSNNANFGQNVSASGLINRTDNYNNSLGVSANILVYNNKKMSCKCL